jgi:hypothetical protein
MRYSLYGTAAAMVLVAGIGVVSVAGAGANSKPAVATVTTIDRTCDFIETTYDPETNKAMSARGLTDACNSTDEWEKTRDAIRAGQRKKISGSETVHLSYTAPQDGSFHTAELHFTGRDDEFYELQAGDEVKILVSDKDPSKVRKA